MPNRVSPQLHFGTPWLAVAVCVAIGAAACAQDANEAYWPSSEGTETAYQQPMPTAPPPSLGGPGAAPADDQEEKGWLFSSPLVDIGWPKITMPSWRWKGDDEYAAPSGPGPITRMTNATRNALDRTRTAWNNQLEKLKFGPFRSKGSSDEPGPGEPGFARWFGGGDEPRQQENVAEFVGSERPTLR